MSIRLRLALFLTACLLLISLLAIYAVNTQNESFKKLNSIRLTSEELTLATEKIDNHFQKQLLAWSNLLLKGLNPDQYYLYLQAFYAQERVTRKLVSALKDDMAQYPAAENKMQEFSRLHARLGLRFRKAIKIYNQSENPVIETDEYLGDITVKPVELLSQVKKNLIEQKQKSLQVAELEYQENINEIIVIAVVAIILLSALFIWLLDITVGRPLSTTIEIAKRVSSGDYNLRVENGMPGEFTVFAKAFNHMLDRLSYVNSDLEEKKKAAEQASQAKSEFLSNVSHEIRTPLNIVTGYSELLEQTQVDKTQKAYIQSILDGGKSLIKIINDVLDLSKIESGRLSIENKVFNLHEFLAGFESVFTKLITERGLEFELSTNANLPKFIVLDEYRLKQIIQNLISNAIKFTEEGSVRLEVISENGTDKIHKDIIIKVVDTGIGIDKAFHEKIFNQFEQKDGQDSRRYGGTGLGLAICQKLAGMLNGVISVQSSLGDGSCFTLKLIDVELQSIGDKKTEQSLDHIKFKPATILIADDIKANRELIKNIFKNQPLTFLEAEDGNRAFISAAEKKPDVILMDIKMPGIDGVEATKLIRQDEYLRKTPVIAVSAASNKGWDVQDKEMLFEDYLIKPVKINELINSLMKFLDYDETI